jgi:hypothetical protein
MVDPGFPQAAKCLRKTAGSPNSGWIIYQSVDSLRYIACPLVLGDSPSTSVFTRPNVLHFK